MLFWIAVSIAGWAFIAGVATVLTTDDVGRIADDGSGRDVDMLPASGPQDVPGR